MLSYVTKYILLLVMLLKVFHTFSPW